MYVVKVNVDPKLIGSGEMAALIGDAVQARILQQAMDNPHKSLIQLTYENDQPDKDSE